MFAQSPNLGHYIWNELTGLEMLIKNGLLQHFDWIEVGEHDYFSAKNYLINQGFVVRKRTDSKKSFITFKTTNIFLSQACRNWIMKDVLNLSQNRKNHEKKKIVIQIRTGTRSWRNSPQEIALFINKLDQNLDDFEFVIDGYSATPDANSFESQSILQDLDFATQVIKYVDSSVEIYSTIGKDFSTKLKKINEATLVIGPIGSGGVLSNRLLDIPAICFGPESYYSWTSRDIESLVWNPRQPIWFYPVNKINYDSEGGYSIDMLELSNMTIDILKIEIMSKSQSD